MDPIAPIVPRSPAIPPVTGSPAVQRPGDKPRDRREQGRRERRRRPPDDELDEPLDDDDDGRPHIDLTA